jgi:hypothetical protein
MIASLAAAMARAFRRTLLPLAAYYAVTVVVPLANGAAQSGPGFAHHMLVVVVVPPVIIALAGGLSAVLNLTAWRNSPFDPRVRHSNADANGACSP